MGFLSAKARTIVVTGGGSGMGRAASLLCAKSGDNVAILDENSQAALATAADAGANCALAIPCDVTAEEQVEEAFEAVGKTFGPPYGLFANAGVDGGGLIHELPLAAWRFVLETNLTGVYLSCKHALRKMLAALVRCMAIDYARYGIRVNSILPGATETPLMWANVPAEEIPKMPAQVETEVPLGRLAQPKDAASGVAWLLSNESAYVTGSNPVYDDGILAKACISV
jgi:NAD(P)-dependent dehydrogenase (short-subunit alcohol dehydrogenase family)